MTKRRPSGSASSPACSTRPTAAERYRLATEQIVHAERCGFDSAWVAQHHFHEAEGGLPAPFVFLAHVAAARPRASGSAPASSPCRWRLPVRVAEDAAVLDLLSRRPPGSGRRAGRQPRPPSPPSASTRNDRHKLMNGNLELLRTAWARRRAAGRRQALSGEPAPGRSHLAGDLLGRRRAPRRRGRRRPDAVAHPAAPGRGADAPLADIQNPMIDAYLEALPRDAQPRILASRTVFVADDRKEALRLAEIGLRRMRHRLAATGNLSSGSLVGDLIAAFDMHLGTPDEVIASLQADTTLQRATDLTLQVHSVDPPHPLHPALDRADRRAGRAGARLGAPATLPNGASPDESGKETHVPTSSTRWPASRRARRSTRSATSARRRAARAGELRRRCSSPRSEADVSTLRALRRRRLRRRPARPARDGRLLRTALGRSRRAGRLRRARSPRPSPRPRAQGPTAAIPRGRSAPRTRPGRSTSRRRRAQRARARASRPRSSIRTCWCSIRAMPRRRLQALLDAGWSTTAS